MLKFINKLESDLKEIQKKQDYILEFKTTNKNVLNYLESNNNLGNDEIFKFKFYSKNNALEFCIKFIKDIQVISPRDIIDEI